MGVRPGQLAGAWAHLGPAGTEHPGGWHHEGSVGTQGAGLLDALQQEAGHLAVVLRAGGAAERQGVATARPAPPAPRGATHGLLAPGAADGHDLLAVEGELLLEALGTGAGSLTAAPQGRWAWTPADPVQPHPRGATKAQPGAASAPVQGTDHAPSANHWVSHASQAAEPKPQRPLFLCCRPGSGTHLPTVPALAILAPPVDPVVSDNGGLGGERVRVGVRGAAAPQTAEACTSLGPAQETHLADIPGA